MLRTKIVCTLGPSSDDEATIRAFIGAGMAVARINFSHGAYDDHARRIGLVRRAAADMGRVVAVLADLQGPKLRVGALPPEGVALVEGQTVTLTSQVPPPGPGAIPLPHPEVIGDVRPGDRILLDDGLLELRVVDHDETSLRAQVVTGGVLLSRKGLSLPHTSLKLQSVTTKDRADAAFALEQEVDYFALSFVRCADDVGRLRAWLAARSADTPIIAKIEKPEALDCIEAILDVSDGLMVARGDLGIEAPAEQVPIAQKRIIRACNEAGKPAITATQMLDSMIRNPRPTRAEASDIANAILDGSDAIMLSGETAMGRYPLASVQMMARIAAVTEQHIPYGDWLRRTMHAISRNVTDAISQAVCELAAELGAAAIITSTMSGSTARQIACHRPATPIIAPTPSPRTCRQLALVWGVEPLLVDQFTDTDAMICTAVEAARGQGLVQNGDLAIITAGVPVGGAGLTNMIKVHHVGEEQGWR
ncbi:MAG: pyruvate kinase [Anaerolineae bacterium]|nr:pyruvate kinase [Anaerolineae bacterium]